MKASGNKYGVSGAALLSAAIAMIAGPATGQTIEEDLKITGFESGPRFFGSAVAVSGSVVVIGEPGGVAEPNQDGAAYAFDVNTGGLLFELRPAIAKDAFVHNFGGSVAVRGNIAAVGGFHKTDESWAGAVFVFDVSTGEQLFRLDDPGLDLDPSVGNYAEFGYSVAINDDVIVVGRPTVIAPEWANAFVFDVDTGERLLTLSPEANDIANAPFGATLAVTDKLVAVGTPGIPFQTEVFALGSGDKLYEVSPPDQDPPVFGYAVGISDSFLVFGAALQDPGAAFVYDAQGGDFRYTLTPPKEDEVVNFGRSVAVEGSLAVIGAYSVYGDSGVPGVAYIFDLNTGEQLLKLSPTDSESDDDFGRAVAIDGATVIVGKARDDDVGTNEGAAYIFTLPPFDCPGDATGDSMVDLADLNLVLANFGETTDDGDATGDGQVDLADLNLVLANFGTSCG